MCTKTVVWISSNHLTLHTLVYIYFDKFGNTAIMNAAMNGKVEVTALLIQKGGDIHSQNDVSSDSAYYVKLFHLSSL